MKQAVWSPAHRLRPLPRLEAELAVRAAAGLQQLTEKQSAGPAPRAHVEKNQQPVAWENVHLQRACSEAKKRRKPGWSWILAAQKTRAEQPVCRMRWRETCADPAGHGAGKVASAGCTVFHVLTCLSEKLTRVYPYQAHLIPRF